MVAQREPIFQPGGIIRVAAFLVFALVIYWLSGTLYAGMDWLLTALGWPA